MKYLELIPKNWNELKLKDYLKILPMLEDIDDDNEVVQAMFYVFIGKMINQTDIKADEVTAIDKRLLFISQPPKSESNIKWKALSDLNYQSYINYQKFSEQPIDNLHKIVKIFAPDDLNVEDINVADAMGCFFLQKKKMKLRLLSSQISLIYKMIKQLLVIFLQKKRNWFKMNFKINGAGLK